MMDWTSFTDWLGREGGEVLRWWLLVTLAGAITWPLLARVMHAVPDRGYSLARAAGLMLTGFVFWLLGSLGLLRNTPGGIAFAWLIVLALSAAAWARRSDRAPLRPWLREHWPLVVAVEVLFALLLVGWAALRAHNPEMYTTEKPMELMFVNSIRASDAFPPRDAWLSGYAISYYYFGYMIVAMLAELSSLESGVAFNLTIALIVALAGTGVLGLVYNLVRARGGARIGALAAGALALVMLIFMGNLGTALVEFPYQGYAHGLVGAGYFDFWDLEERAGTVSTAQMAADGSTITVEVPSDRDGDGVPDWDEAALPTDRWEFLRGMGWRYSRVVHDRLLDGTPHPIQPITEFPNFSFTLADIHPHVLALPFALLAVGLGLALVLGGRAPTAWEYPLYAIWVGGMIFMNSWDLVYLPLLIGAEALRRLIRGQGALHAWDLVGLLRFAVIVIGLTLIFYLPWLISFTSQAGGILPNVVYPTPWQQFVLQFGAFLAVLTVFLIVEARRAGSRFNARAGLLAAGAIALGAVLVVSVLGLVVWRNTGLRQPVFSVWEDAGGLLGDILRRRLIGLPTELWLLALIALAVGRLFARRLPGDQDDPARTPPAYSPATGFVLLLIGAGAALTLAPDLVYLRDNFAVRINTVFKLYYQGWILFSVAAGFGVWSVLAGREDARPRRKSRARGALQTAFAALVVLLIGAGLLYPLFAAPARLREYSGAPTLQGAPTMVSADEYAAVQCLIDLEPARDAVLLEAPCNCGYQPQYGRFATLSGIPTLLGWGNHEGQWRGATLPLLLDTRVENGVRRDRISDAQELYTTQDWARVWQVIDRYGIDYLVVGAAERQMAAQLAGDDAGRARDYQLGLDKFARVLTPVCEVGGTAVYRVADK